MRHRWIGPAVAAGLTWTGCAAMAGDDCGDFPPLHTDVVDMALSAHEVFDEPGLGAAASYRGPDGSLTFYRFDLGFDHISEKLLDESTEQAVRDIATVVGIQHGDVVKILSSGQVRTIGNVALRDVIVVSDMSGVPKFDFLATGTDGRCLYKVRYTPDVSTIDDEGRNVDGLVVFERFNRALDDLAPYFSG